MIKTIKDLEETLHLNVDLTFEEYQKIKEPAVQIVINDYASKLMEEVAQKGGQLSREEALEIAKNEIPANFVPEWMKSLRIGANLAGTEVVFMNQIVTELQGISELLQVCFEEKIENYCLRHAEDFKRVGGTEGGDAVNGE
jgi:hypothetical protein